MCCTIMYGGVHHHGASWQHVVKIRCIDAQLRRIACSGVSSNTAASVVQAFQDDYEVAALDLRGYGKSDKPKVSVLRRVYRVQLTNSWPVRVDGIL